MHKKPRGHTFSTVVDMMPVVPNYATKVSSMVPSSGLFLNTRLAISQYLRRRSFVFCWAVMRCKKASQRSDLVMPNLFVCGGGGGMNLLEGFWWGKFLVCGSRVANDVSAFAGPNRFGKEGIYS